MGNIETPYMCYVFFTSKFLELGGKMNSSGTSFPQLFLLLYIGVFVPMLMYGVNNNQGFVWLLGAVFLISLPSCLYCPSINCIFCFFELRPGIRSSWEALTLMPISSINSCVL